MDGAGHAVLELQVHLGDGVLSEDRGIGDVTYIAASVSAFPVFRVPISSPQNIVKSLNWSGLRRTDGGGLNHVADGESLDRLVLGSASRAVRAADGLDVATALLVATAIREKTQCQLSTSGISRYRLRFLRSTHLDARFLTILANSAGAEKVLC